jgi:hypothetical protein
MTWQAFVVPDYLSMGRGVHIYLGLKRPDGSMDVVQPMELVTQRYEEQVVPSPPPALKLDGDVAHALLDALAAHYGGTSDLRRLRADYDAERCRVDKMIDRLTLPERPAR